MRAIARFFLIVGMWHPAVVGGLAAVVVVAGGLLAARRMAAVDALAPLLVLQVLATSSGFAVPARRGHYDFLIAAGHRRLWIALVHWAISAAPGLAGWFAIAVIEVVASRGGAISSLAPGAIAGILVVSTLPWAVTVPLPRLTGGLVWIVLLVAAVTVVRVPALTTVLMCPWLMARHGVTSELMLPASILAMASMGAMSAAIVWIQRADFPLETAQ